MIGPFTDKARTTTKYIVVHCSATYPSMDTDADTIDRWHKDRGWEGIGYHVFIKRDGTPEAGRPLETVGAHCKGFNSVSVGICLAGGLKEGTQIPEDNFTKRQMDTLARFLVELKKAYPVARVVGHYQLESGKSCPAFDIEKFVRMKGL